VEECADAAKLPRAGPLVFYSNHPYGFADALIGLSVALSRRPDTRVLANRALSAFDFHAAHPIWVDLGKGAERLATNRRALRETLRHLEGGGALLIFPSQTCSHLRLPECRVTDPPWSPHLLSLVDRTGAACVPLFFEGRNSWRFQLLGLVHPVFRTLLLLRELIALRGQCIRVRIGPAIAHAQSAPRERAEERLRRLREAVYALENGALRPSAPRLSGTDAGAGRAPGLPAR
jgi:putative hemolysin